jgi:hypothetical protein
MPFVISKGEHLTYFLDCHFGRIPWLVDRDAFSLTPRHAIFHMFQ